MERRLSPGRAELRSTSAALESPVAMLSAGIDRHDALDMDEDVDTVEALAEALLAYKGTVLFTSHDRHFMKRIATSVIEVRDGGAKNYSGGYDTYLYAVNKEIDEGERQLNAAKSKNGKPSGKPAGKAPKADHREAQRDQRKIRKEITNCERSIARLDEQKRGINAQLLEATDPQKALQLHNELEVISNELAAAEERWCELQQQQTDDE